MDFLFLDSKKCPNKSRRFLHALYRSAKKAGASCAIEPKYTECNALVVYGLGGADRYSVGMEHMASGKPLLSFDLGYWGRKLPHRKYRFSLNGLHPWQVMETKYPGPGRWNKSGLTIKTLPTNDSGPILLVGNAPKSIAVGAKNWTAEKSREIRRAFPGRKILYRPKPKRPHESGVVYDGVSDAPIDAALKQSALVVCRHSNVAVDACRLGIPVVCEDGAAASIYPRRLADWEEQPDLKTRTEFLHRLAYWQWGLNEVELFWGWFFNTFPAYDYRRFY